MDHDHSTLKVFAARPPAPKVSRSINPPLEKDIERKIGEYAKSKGFMYIKFVSPAHRAVPDRLLISPQGRIGFLEIKRPPNKPTPLQMRELQTLLNHGCTAAWCDSVEEGKHFVDQLNQPTEFC